MRTSPRITVAAALAVAALTGAVLPASAAPAYPAGVTCGFVGTMDPELPNSVTGVLFGGPFVLGDDTDPTITYTGEVECRIVAEGSYDITLCGMWGPETPVAAASVAVCTFDVTGVSRIRVCTTVTYEGGYSYNYPNPNWPILGGDRYECATVLEVPVDLTPVRPLLDSFICFPLQILFPPQGDIPGVHDCPPYDYPPGEPRLARTFVAIPGVSPGELAPPGTRLRLTRTGR